jgi:hypothetical protein
MFLGYYQLGDLLPVSVWTLDSASTPTVPDDVPVVHVYDSSGDVITARLLPVIDPAKITGYFQYRINLDAKFSTGYHTVMVNYVISSANYARIHHFEILGGGNSQGVGMAMHFFKQPAADYVLLQTDTGSLKRLRNPSVRGI